MLVDALEACGITQLGGEPRSTTWTPEQSLAVMDRFGIATAILSVPTTLPPEAAPQCLARENQPVRPRRRDTPV
ncbi:MAG TPA: hypothetical protein VH541_02045 [Gaiellaceae bacterium]